MKGGKQEYVQLTLSLSRFDRRDIIRELVLPATQKSILRELNDFAERTGTCFPSQAKLATCCGCSKRTIQTHLDALANAGLIISTPRTRSGSRGATSNQYAIVWEELAVRTNRTFRTTAADQVATVADQVATVADQVATVADQVANSAPLETTREDKRETTTETEWRSVVVLLGSYGVGKARDAIATARARHDTPADVRRIIERIAKDPNIEPTKRAGAIYNQVCNPTPESLPSRPPQLMKRPNKERILERLLFQAIKTDGIRPIDVDHQAMDARAEQLFQLEMERFSSLKFGESLTTQQSSDQN